MNTPRCVAIVAFSLVTFAAHAREPANKIVLSCPVSRTPNLQDVADVVGTTNMWASYNARERVLELAKRACKRGADYVSIVSGNEPANTVARNDAKAASDLPN